MEEEYMQGTTKGKIKFFLTLSSALFLFLALKYIWDIYLPAPVDGTDEAVKQYTHNVVSAVVSISVFMFFIYLYYSICFYKYGNLVKACRQEPPPGKDIPFTKKIVRGDKAVKYARNSYIFSGLLIFIGLFKIGVSIYLVTVFQELNIAF